MFPEVIVPPFRIELRSDTQTVPTADMRAAMAAAEVGDDQGGEDPTVRRLEEMAAEIFQKEAALFVSSGTMGNLVSLLTLVQRGDSVIVDPVSHVSLAEAGGFATLAGCSLIPVVTDGVMTAEAIKPLVGPVTTHSLKPAIIWAENTHNRRGGVAWGPDVLEGLVGLAREHKLRTHIDGARIFNAATAIGVPVAELAMGTDTVQFCLSKGLGAPFGSMIVGGRELITEARRTRQLVGGGMRQAGVMAAAGLIALRDGPGCLAQDHQRARLLGAVIEDLPGLRLLSPVHTNLVFVTWDPDQIDIDRWVELAGEQGLGIGDPRGDMLRLVTHHQVSDADISDATDILAAAANEAAVVSHR
jgi:threonine aldolase